jgi:hypothetical protein
LGIDVGVRDDDELAGIGLDQSGAGFDRLHRSLDVTDPDLIAAMKRAADQDEHAGQPVLQNVLEGEAERDRADAKAGEDINRSHVRQHDRDHDQEAEEYDAPECETAEHLAEVAAAGALHSVAQDARQPKRDPKEEESDDEPGDQIRQDVKKSLDPIIEALIKRAPDFVHAHLQKLAPRYVRRGYNRQVVRRVPLADTGTPKRKRRPFGRLSASRQQKLVGRGCPLRRGARHERGRCVAHQSDRQLAHLVRRTAV